MNSATFLAMLVLSIMFFLSAAAPLVNPVLTLASLTEPRYLAPTLVGEHKTSTSTSVVLPTFTSSIPATSTSSTSPPIASKTSVPDCNYEAWPATIILEYFITSGYNATALDCQTTCEQSINATTGLSYPEPCLSYSFTPGTDINYPNCELFSIPFNGTDPVDGATYVIYEPFCGMFWSDRWPVDGSGFCYS